MVYRLYRLLFTCFLLKSVRCRRERRERRAKNELIASFDALFRLGMWTQYEISIPTVSVYMTCKFSIWSFFNFFQRKVSESRSIESYQFENGCFPCSQLFAYWIRRLFFVFIQSILVYYWINWFSMRTPEKEDGQNFSETKKKSLILTQIPDSTEKFNEFLCLRLWPFQQNLIFENDFQFIMSTWEVLREITKAFIATSLSPSLRFPIFSRC